MICRHFSIYIYAMVVLKTLFTVIGDLSFIPLSGVNGVAYSNIAVNAVCVILCLIAVYRENLIAVSFRFEKSFLKKYGSIRLFSGAQILLDNLIYAAIVCKMVNQVAEQGNYWVAKEEDAYLFHLEMWMYVHGIAATLVSSYLEWEEDFISRVLTDGYEGLKSRYARAAFQERDGK